MLNNKILQLLGLTDNEILVYEFLLAKGELGIGEILKKSKLVRGSAYHILNSLKEKGLIDEGEYHGKKTFIAKNPMVLEDLLETKIKELEINQVELKQCLPDVLSGYLLTTKTPLISSFKGLEGLEKIYQHVLKVKEPLSIFVSHFDRVSTEFSNLINEQIKLQYKAKIEVRSLSTIKEYSQAYWDFAREHGIQIRVPENRSNLPAQVLVYGDNVAFTSFVGEYVSTLISNPAIAKSMMMIFDSLWQNADLPKIVKKPMKNKVEI